MSNAMYMRRSLVIRSIEQKIVGKGHLSKRRRHVGDKCLWRAFVYVVDRLHVLFHLDLALFLHFLLLFSEHKFFLVLSPGGLGGGEVVKLID
jgi:hypothetical protein